MDVAGTDELEALPELEAYLYITEHAACVGADPTLFFTVKGDGAEVSRQKNKKAKKICSMCKVRKECLDYALKYNDYGTWGGKTANERRKMKRRESQ